MIDHPFLSFKDLSDDELLQKTQDIHRNLSRASMWGSSLDTINQLEWMLEMIDEEKMERAQKANFDAMVAMFPDTVESDPDFKASKGEPEDDSKTTIVKPASRKPQNLPAPLFHKEYTDKDDQK